MLTSALLHHVASIILGAIVALLVVRQFRRPQWLLGQFIAMMMNRSHRRLTSWALEQVCIARDSFVLDVGCGGGATVARIAALAPDGQVHGVDHSVASVATARRANAGRIRDRRVRIQLGSASRLPFEAGVFDVVTAIETHYYWPVLERDLGEVRRVLRDGGVFLLAAEAYRGRRMDWLYRPAMAALGATYLTPEEHSKALVAAGFEAVRTTTHAANGWICAIGCAGPTAAVHNHDENGA